MSCIRSSKNRSTERRLRSILVGSGVRGWIMHASDLEGRPDFVFEHQKIAIFVDGCFWHGCRICYRRPKSRQRYWDWKLSINRKRDRKVNLILKRNGYRVLRFWEHEVQEYLQQVLKKIISSLHNP